MTAISDARNAVLERDGFRCVAPLLDADAGPCFDAWGHPFGGYDPTGIRLEVDRVQPEPGSRKVTHLDVDSMYSACPGHHRGAGPNRGYVWATAHRELLRDHLRKIVALKDADWAVVRSIREIARAEGSTTSADPRHFAASNVRTLANRAHIVSKKSQTP